MADGSSSVTTTKPPAPSSSNPSLPIEYQIRPPNLPSPRESPLTGLATHPYRPRSIWYELWKSKLALILFISSSTFVYLDYQRTKRYKLQKALKAASETKPYSLFVQKHENLRQDDFQNRSHLMGGMQESNW